MLQRILNLPNLLKKKSFFLFGPRATGKSTLIETQLNHNTPIIDLLDSELYLRLSTKPQELKSLIMAYPDFSVVVIDEIQRIPELLNEVHSLIEKQKIRFLLTGSSARKLKKGHVNLLAGRAWTSEIFPLTSHEIPAFDLQRYLRYGGLPAIYLSAEPEEELHAYVGTYLKEEIQAEALVRQIPVFSRFLQTSAVTSGQMLNFSELANDTGIPVSTVREYYQILADTFLGFLLPAWTKSVKRKALSTAKFYYFDIGVKNTLAGIQAIEPKSDLYGQSFEHFMAMELRAYLSYNRKKIPMSYWHSKHGYEVDFILGDDIAIEIKTTDKTSDKHFKSLKMLAEENICKRYLLVSHDKLHRKEEQFEALYWQDFLIKLWGGEII